jgi:predicted pyridoxine 5'-phosphate oxidase superfamily flavin-nucleotide-binding protein
VRLYEPADRLHPGHRRRIKVWGASRLVEGAEALMRRLMPEGYRARPEQVVLFNVTAWDVNCPQHIPQRFEASYVEAVIKERYERIALLEAEVERLREGRAENCCANDRSSLQ